MEKKILPNFIPVFEQRFKDLLKRIEKEYDKPKSERNKDHMKKLSKDAKSLRKLFRDCAEQMGSECCPHCGKEIGRKR